MTPGESRRPFAIATLLPLLSLLLMAGQPSNAADRARELGIPFLGRPGALNAITDVPGVEVGHSTVIEGDGALSRGAGPIRTGVTVVHPRGKNSTEAVFGGWFTLNASGEMTGTTWLEERGVIDGPIGITNTHSVGTVRDAFVAWMVDAGWSAIWHAPVVAETYDGALNDINGQHVTGQHVLEALKGATSGPVGEGALGGGTGMVCNGFKGGIGTASRIFEANDRSFTLGVLVQCNYNWGGEDLRLGARPVAELLPVGQHCHTDRRITPAQPWFPYCDGPSSATQTRDRDGSIIVIIATDAPLLPHQLKRVAKRPSLALGRLGAVSNAGSGDIFIAFATGNAGNMEEDLFNRIEQFPNQALDRVFRAAVQATEEAIVNAMSAAKTMVGADGLRVMGMPHAEVRQIFNTAIP